MSAADRSVRPMRHARLLVGLLVMVVVSGCGALSGAAAHLVEPPLSSATTAAGPGTALLALSQLAVKGRAPKTGYARSQFGQAWTDSNSTLWGGDGLSTRENILSRDLTHVVCKIKRSAPILPPCVVQSGVLLDPYTGDTADFVRGQHTSSLIPIDHAVSLSDAWQKGAQQLSAKERVNLGNDPLNLVATTRAANTAKRDSDIASWMVPNKAFRCAYSARQIAVKRRYRLWVTQAEHDTFTRVLSRCPSQLLPTDADAARRTTY